MSPWCSRCSAEVKAAQDYPVSVTEQACSLCCETRPASEFGRCRTKKSGLASWCRGCTYEKGREGSLQRNYGMTVADYTRMLDEQGGGCAICGAEPPTEGRQRHLHVDHDHATGQVRSLLCHNCNTSIGLLGESVERAFAVAEYLERHARALTLAS